MGSHACCWLGSQKSLSCVFLCKSCVKYFALCCAFEVVLCFALMDHINFQCYVAQGNALPLLKDDASLGPKLGNLFYALRCFMCC